MHLFFSLCSFHRLIAPCLIVLFLLLLFISESFSYGFRSLERFSARLSRLYRSPALFARPERSAFAPLVRLNHRVTKASCPRSKNTDLMRATAHFVCEERRKVINGCDR